MNSLSSFTYNGIACTVTIDPNLAVATREDMIIELLEAAKFLTSHDDETCRRYARSEANELFDKAVQDRLRISRPELP